MQTDLSTMKHLLLDRVGGEELSRELRQAASDEMRKVEEGEARPESASELVRRQVTTGRRPKEFRRPRHWPPTRLSSRLQSLRPSRGLAASSCRSATTPWRAR